MTETFLETSAATQRRLLRRGLRLEYATLAWNLVGSVLVLVAAAAARSVALAGFGLDSLIEIVASAVVVWQLRGVDKRREQRALRVIGVAFVLLALYIGAQSIYVFVVAFRPHHSEIGIVWLALTAVAMFALAYGKSTTGRALGNRVLQTEARVTVIDGLLAASVLVGLTLNAALAGGGPTRSPPSSSSTTAGAKAEPLLPNWWAESSRSDVRWDAHPHWAAGRASRRRPRHTQALPSRIGTRRRVRRQEAPAPT